MLRIKWHVKNENNKQIFVWDHVFRYLIFLLVFDEHFNWKICITWGFEYNYFASKLAGTSWFFCQDEKKVQHLIDHVNDLAKNTQLSNSNKLWMNFLFQYQKLASRLYASDLKTIKYVNFKFKSQYILGLTTDKNDNINFDTHPS